MIQVLCHTEAALAAAAEAEAIAEAQAAQAASDTARRRNKGAAEEATPETAPKTPEEFLCPITQCIFRDPVTCVGDGETYEKSAVEQWISKKREILERAQKELEETNGRCTAQTVVAGGIPSLMATGRSRAFSSAGAIHEETSRRLALQEQGRSVKRSV